MTATHLRRQIRDFVKAGLSGGNALALTGARVYVGQTRPLPVNFEPSLLIYTRAETSARAWGGDPPLAERGCMLHIEGRVSTDDPPDDLLDDIALQIEAGVAALIDYGSATFFGGLAQDVELKSTETIAKAEGEKHIGSIQLTYLVTYKTAEGDPSQPA